ncbi:MAG: cyclic nucleotide-binding domain-containing protein [Deltaproteobacteria bacterium]|nr:cyclic nucleotide-binding domain-containing protein [Deltaproteobacteria bacterium]
MTKYLKNHFSDTDQKTIKELLVEVEYPPHSELIKTGASVNQMLYLARGYVKVTCHNPEYHMPVVLAVLGPGATFGEEMV